MLSEYLRPSARLLGTMILLLFFPNSKIAADTACSNVCLKGLIAAAYNRVHVDQSTFDQKTFRHDFCSAIHELKSNQNDTSDNLLTEYFYNEYKSKSSSVDDYDQRYCLNESADLTSDTRYAFWSEFVDAKALDTFRDCMRTCNPQFGLSGDFQNIDSCHFSVSFKYAPNSRWDFPPKCEGVQVTNASCTGLPKVHQAIKFGGAAVSCIRNGPSSSALIVNTNKGVTIIAVPPANLPNAPSPPVFDTQMYDADEKNIPYITECTVGREMWKGSPCTECTDTCPVLSGGYVPDANHITYTCAGAGCGYSYNRAPGLGYEKDVQTYGTYFRWWRRWTAGDIRETYTIRYQMPRQVCTANCDFEKRKMEYDQAVAAAACPPKKGTH